MFLPPVMSAFLVLFSISGPHLVVLTHFQYYYVLEGHTPGAPCIPPFLTPQLAVWCLPILLCFRDSVSLLPAPGDLCASHFSCSVIPGSPILPHTNQWLWVYLHFHFPICLSSPSLPAFSPMAGGLYASPSSTLAPSISHHHQQRPSAL